MERSRSSLRSLLILANTPASLCPSPHPVLNQVTCSVISCRPPRCILSFNGFIEFQSSRRSTHSFSGKSPIQPRPHLLYKFIFGVVSFQRIQATYSNPRNIDILKTLVQRGFILLLYALNRSYTVIQYTLVHLNLTTLQAVP